MSRVLETYSVVVMWVTAASWAIWFHHPRFDNRPLFAISDRFQDLLNYSSKTAHLYHGAAKLGFGAPTFNYPAPAAFVYKMLLYTVPAHPVRFYLCLLAICAMGFAFVAWRASRASGVNGAVRLSATMAIGTTALLGYPMLYAADRGNTEGAVWVVCAAGLCFLLRGRYRTAALLIGMAASIKPFSILFLLLLIGRRKYKAAALGVATSGVLVIAALAYLGPTPWKAYQDLKPGVSRYVALYVENLLPVGESRFAHSILDGMKSAAVAVKVGVLHPQKANLRVGELMVRPGGWRPVHLLVRLYPVVVIAGFGLLFAAFYRMPLLNQMTALAGGVTLFPPVSGEYTLLHLYVPFGAFVVFLTREVATGKVEFPYCPMMAFAVIYGLLFSPLTFLSIYAGDGKLLLLVALLVLAARSPMPSPFFNDVTAEAT